MTANTAPRVDFDVIVSMIEPGARVLDVGCEDGALLERLEQELGVDGRGLELSQRGVNACVARGLSVIQGDADTDLVYYPDKSFDYVILSQTLQAMRNPRTVLNELLRIGKRVIVSFPNFGYINVRLQLLFKGRMPVTRHLPMAWYDTPNIHFCTIRDFINLCDELGARVEKATALDGNGDRIRFSMPWWFWNIFGQQAVFMLRRD